MRYTCTAISASRVYGGIFGAIIPTVIEELVPGACLIAAAVLVIKTIICIVCNSDGLIRFCTLLTNIQLKDVLCLVSILPFLLAFLLNVADMLGILGAGALVLAVPRDSCRGDPDCGSGKIIGAIFGLALIRLIGCIYITVCFIVALGLRQRIRSGVYGARNLFAPPSTTQSVTVAESAIGEKTDSAAEAARLTEEPVEENS